MLTVNEGERRRNNRVIVKSVFHLGIVFPDLTGAVIVDIRNISEGGILFDSHDAVDLSIGDQVKARLYINQSLFMPIEVTISRIKEGEIGAKFVPEGIDPDCQKAIRHFVSFLEIATEKLQVDEHI